MKNEIRISQAKGILAFRNYSNTNPKDEGFKLIKLETGYFS
jgi:hypothetical protein